MNTTRNEAIDSGIYNMMDTIYVDKSMTERDAIRSLKTFVADGLNCYGFDDNVTKSDMEYALSMCSLPITFEERKKLMQNLHI